MPERFYEHRSRAQFLDELRARQGEGTSESDLLAFALSWADDLELRNNAFKRRNDELLKRNQEDGAKISLLLRHEIPWTSVTHKLHGERRGIEIEEALSA